MSTLAIMKQQPKRILTIEQEKALIEKDIIVNRVSKKITYENGKKIEEYEKTPVNLSKKINETKKLLKNYTAEEKIAYFDELAKQQTN